MLLINEVAEMCWCIVMVYVCGTWVSWDMDFTELAC